jgi:manganese/zinc/iron transport system permease protein
MKHCIKSAAIACLLVCVFCTGVSANVVSPPCTFTFSPVTFSLVSLSPVTLSPVTFTSTITDRSVAWPSWDQWCRVLLLQDYNTRVVVLGTTLLGCAAGMVGSFTLIRKRALMGDALSHATLPGIGLAFMLATSLGGDGKSLPILLLGATVTGLMGMATILMIRNWTRLKEDTALGAVLSVFFGAGVALLGVIQQMKHGHAAGLEAFIYGKTASMGVKDTLLIATAALVCMGICMLLFKEFKLLCFDEGFASSHGFPVVRLDLALMGLVVIITIVGLQAVGLILMIALLVIPAAAARFWTEKMLAMIFISASLGAAGGMFGSAISALFSKLPSGAMIVLVCTVFFLFSMVFGSARGVVIRWVRRTRLNRTVDRQHLLRAIYEILETSANLLSKQSAGGGVVSIRQLKANRSWSLRRLHWAIRRAQRAQYVERTDEQIHLTRRGLVEAARLTRQHRLWELYLITHADIAPGQVDRDADAIEHVLEPEVVAELESQLEKTPAGVPASPHELVLPHDVIHSTSLGGS